MGLKLGLLSLEVNNWDDIVWHKLVIIITCIFIAPKLEPQLSGTGASSALLHGSHSHMGNFYYNKITKVWILIHDFVMWGIENHHQCCHLPTFILWEMLFPLETRDQIPTSKGSLFHREAPGNFVFLSLVSVAVIITYELIEFDQCNFFFSWCLDSTSFTLKCPWSFLKEDKSILNKTDLILSKILLKLQFQVSSSNKLATWSFLLERALSFPGALSYE